MPNINWKHLLAFTTLGLTLLCMSPLGMANEGDDEHEPTEEHLDRSSFYRSPEERREAGLGHQITEWLKLSGLLEFERERQQFKFIDGQSGNEKSPVVKAAQLAFDFSFSENIEAEVVLELEKDGKSRALVDEAALTWDIGEFGLTLGRFSPAFGEYFSHFVIGPMLEFGETRASTLEIDYGFSDNLQIGLFALHSEVGTKHSSSDIDWGWVAEWTSDNESTRFALSYLSDIGEGDEGFFDDPELLNSKPAGAISAYAMIGLEQFEITAEIVKTLDKLSDYDAQYDQPKALNLELAYFPQEYLQLAFRYEYSKELIEQPKSRYGLGVRWLVLDNVSIAMDYFVGDYRHIVNVEDTDSEEESALDSDFNIEELAIRDEKLIAFQVSIEF